MRYYDIIIGSGAGNQGLNSLSSSGGRFTSHPSGVTNPPDPGALNVEIDATVTSPDLANAQTWVRVWGISLQDISQSRNLNPVQQGSPGLPVYIYGGMGRGLPLAQPAQSGLLFSGTIFQAYGNWIGTQMTLDFQVIPGTGRVPPGIENRPVPVNLVWRWQAGTPMSQAIAQALNSAFPNYKQNIQISQDLVRANDEVGVYKTWPQLQQYILDLSKAIKNTSGYHGVRILLQNDMFTVFDGTQQSTGSGVTTKNVSFIDLIGQPTWINLTTVQVTCVMRADIRPGDQITLPPGLQTTGQNSFAQFRQGSVFQGTLQVLRVRHVGNFRQPEAMSWVTVIDAVLQPQASSTVSSPPGNVTTENIQITPL